MKSIRSLKRASAVCLGALLLGGTAAAQAFTTYQNTLLHNLDHDHYSVLDAADGNGHVFAGTLFDPNNNDATDIHVALLSELGKPFWERVFDSGGNERCFNIAHAPGGYVLTGFVEVGGLNKLYLLRLDLGGNVVFQNRYDDLALGQHSHGLSVVHTPVDNGFIIAGFISSGFGSSDAKQAMVVKTDALGIPIWERYFDSPNLGSDYNMAENVEVIPPVPGAGFPGGYFVTGSTNAPVLDFNFVQIGTAQGVLALMLDGAGTPLWDSSFFSQNPVFANDLEVGADSRFDPLTNEIFLLSNNTELHNCALTALDLGGGITKAWGFGPTDNYVGLSIVDFPDPNRLVISGMVRSVNFTVPDGQGVPTAYFNNTVPFLTAVSKDSAFPSWSVFYPIPSSGYVGHGGFFSAFNGQQPNILTPKAGAWTDDERIVLPGYRTNLSSNIDLEALKVIGKVGISDCNDMPLPFFKFKGNRNKVPKSVPTSPGILVSPGPFVSLPLKAALARCGQPL